MSLLEQYPRLAQVANYAQQHIQDSAEALKEPLAYGGAAYRWQHTLRVAHFGQVIAEHAITHLPE